MMMMMMIQIQTQMALIFFHHVIMTVVFCLMTSNAVSRTFKLQANSTGSQMCAVDKPSAVIRMETSTMAGRCGTLCNVKPCCEVFQFKEDLAQCELFNYSPSNFSPVDRCTAYAAPPGRGGKRVVSIYKFQGELETSIWLQQLSC